MLGYILLAFLIGMILGYKKKLNFLKKYKPVWIVTFLLLFFMGYEIGKDDNLFSRLSEIGYIAFLIAIFTIIGSYFFTSFYEKIINKEKNNK